MTRELKHSSKNKLNLFLTQNRIDNFQDFESELAKLDDQKLKGDLFESFAEWYIKSKFPDIKNYWPQSPPKEILDKLGLDEKTADSKGEAKYGFDSVIEDQQGELSLVQVKYRDPDKRGNRPNLLKADLGSLTIDGYNNDASLMLFSNAGSLPADYRGLKKRASQYTAVLADKLLSLDADDFTDLKLDLSSSLKREALGEKPKNPYSTFSPEKDEYQKEAKAKIKEELAVSGKAQFIAPTGAGKTQVYLELLRENKEGEPLVLVPNLSLLGDLIKRCGHETVLGKSFDPIVICSKSEITQNNETSLENGIEADRAKVDLSELHLDKREKATTNVDEAAKLLSSEVKPGKRRVVFSTYQSSKVLKEACAKSNSKFSFAVFDEAHNAAVANQKSERCLALYNENVEIDKRLFVSATPKMIKTVLKAGGKSIDDAEQRITHSMDNEKIFGKIAFKMGMAEAIEKGICSEYKVIFAGISKEELDKELPNLGIELDDDIYKAETVAQALAIRKVSEKYNIDSAFTWSNKVANSKNLADIFNRKEISKDMSGKHLDGKSSTSVRRETLKDLENKKLNLIFNCLVCAEGIDTPNVKASIFAEGRSGPPAVQSIGRALRTHKDKDMSYIVIVGYFPDDKSRNPENPLAENSPYKGLIQVLEALKSEDDRLSDVISIYYKDGLKDKRKGFKPGSGNLRPEIIVETGDEKLLNEISNNIRVKVCDLLSSNKKEIKFELMVEKIETWRKENPENPDTLIPSQKSKNPEEKKLGEWLSSIVLVRKGYEKNRFCELKESKNPEIIKSVSKLEELIDPRYLNGSLDKNDLSFIGMVNQLSEWQEQAGKKGVIPSRKSNNPEENKLGVWLSSIVRARKGYQQNRFCELKESDNPEITKSVSKLKELIDPRYLNGSLDKNDLSFIGLVNQLSKWQEQAGKKGVIPSTHSKNPEEKKLAQWLSGIVHARKGYEKNRFCEFKESDNLEIIKSVSKLEKLIDPRYLNGSLDKSDLYFIKMVNQLSKWQEQAGKKGIIPSESYSNPEERKLAQRLKSIVQKRKGYGKNRFCEFKESDNPEIIKSVSKLEKLIDPRYLNGTLSAGDLSFIEKVNQLSKWQEQAGKKGVIPSQVSKNPEEKKLGVWLNRIVTDRKGYEKNRFCEFKESDNLEIIKSVSKLEKLIDPRYLNGSLDKSDLYFIKMVNQLSKWQEQAGKKGVIPSATSLMSQEERKLGEWLSSIVRARKGSQQNRFCELCEDAEKKPELKPFIFKLKLAIDVRYLRGEKTAQELNRSRSKEASRER